MSYDDQKKSGLLGMMMLDSTSTELPKVTMDPLSLHFFKILI
jgi:hypothetical protein